MQAFRPNAAVRRSRLVFSPTPLRLVFSVRLLLPRCGVQGRGFGYHDMGILWSAV